MLQRCIRVLLRGRVLPALLVVLAARGSMGFASAAEVDRSVHFLRNVMPLVTRLGCNSVQCHGAPLGKGGMPLTLFGGDPEEDYETIAKAQRSTRIDRMEPAKSLLLLKDDRDDPSRRRPEDSARFSGVQDNTLLD